MRKGWEYKKLGEVCTIERGGSPRPINDYITDSEDGINWIKIGDAQEGSKYITSTKEKIKSEGVKKSRFVHKGDFILSNSMSFGRPYILKVDGCIHDGWLVIHDNNDIFIKDYLYYLLASPTMYAKFSQLAVGGVVNNLNSSLVRKVEITIPPKSTQLAIVSELDKINELIRLKKEQLKDFDNLAQSLFYEMFGEGKCLRKKLKDIVKIQSGQVSPLEEPYSEMIHIGPANIESNTGRLLNLKTAKEENLISGKYLFDSSMVLYSKIRPNLNKVTIPSFEGICSADMYPIIPLECIDKNFLLFLLKQKEFLTYAISNSGRANIPKINREALLNYEAILPPLPLQRLFAQRIEQIEREKSEVQKSIQDLETLLASRMQYWFE